MMRAVIIDDEIRARETVRTLLKMYCEEDVEVVGQAKNVKTGIELITEQKPDLVFLDIKMPDGSGFDLLSRYGKIDFKVVFITAFEEYAIRAFKFSAIDYVLKPIDPPDLIKAVSRAKAIVDSYQPNTMNEQFEALLDNMQNNQDKKIVLKTTENIYIIPVKDIVALSSDRNYTRFYFKDKPAVIVSKTLKEFEGILFGYGFMRIHRSHVINLKHIERFERNEGGYAIMRGDLKLEVSHRKKDDLLAFFEKL